MFGIDKTVFLIYNYAIKFERDFIMKKIITLLLTVMLVLSLMTVYVSAEKKNYAEGVKWDEFSCNISKSGDSYIATGITSNYASPAADILLALREAIGYNGLIHATVSFDVRATFTKGANVTSTPGRLIIRGVNADNSLNGPDGITSWTEEYTSALDGDKEFFKNSNGQVIAPFHNVTITNSWSTVTLNLDLTQNQINNNVINRWRLCFDKLDGYKNIEKLEIKNLVINAEVDPSVTAKPQATEAPASDAPTVTRMPHTNVTPTPAPTVNDSNDGASIMPALVTAVVCSVIIGACIISVALVKRKTSK